MSVQYVDHNLLQEDARNADDHLFLRSACRKYGLWFSRPGNGVSHPVHMERFGVPGKTLLGSGSHTCAGGALGMLAIGAGGLEVALAMGGEPFHLSMPRILGIRLVGKLPDWVSAKDVILEMLSRYDVDGSIGPIIEYQAPGLASLTAMDRHVIANMGAELGATTTVFPSDGAVKEFLEGQGRAQDFVEILADADAGYDEEDEIDRSRLEPLIAQPSSPGKVVPVREVARREIYQAYIGSSADPGLRDFAVAAEIVDGRQVHDRVSFDINPTSRQILENMTALGLLGKPLHAGARLHQAGCGGCIGTGQAPATARISPRTVPRNFPGRSGTKEDQVYLCSPETAAASAPTGAITDPCRLDMPYPRFSEPAQLRLNTEILVPRQPENPAQVLDKGPNFQPLLPLEPLPEVLEGPVLLKVGDNISSEEILPAGAKVLPYRNNIPAISRFVFAPVDEDYFDRTMCHQRQTSFLVGGHNDGQGSSREQAASCPRYPGIRAVLSRGFARIHLQNFCNFGILPLVLADPDDWRKIAPGDVLSIAGIRDASRSGKRIRVSNLSN